MPRHDHPTTPELFVGSRTLLRPIGGLSVEWLCLESRGTKVFLSQFIVFIGKKFNFGLPEDLSSSRMGVGALTVSACKVTSASS